MNMDHVAIMKKSWGLIPKIKEFENLTPKSVRKILEKYGGEDDISVSNLERTIKWARKKRYCTLIYLKNPKEIKPFNVDKTGFGAAAAWLCVGKINRIKRPLNRS